MAWKAEQPALVSGDRALIRVGCVRAGRAAIHLRGDDCLVPCLMFILIFVSFWVWRVSTGISRLLDP